MKGGDVMGAPCKNCARREVGCHSTCEDYKEYRVYVDKIKKEEHKQNQFYKLKGFSKK
jgi:hypothetical protein